jgi:hypothetical protein
MERVDGDGDAGGAQGVGDLAVERAGAGKKTQVMRIQ